MARLKTAVVVPWHDKGQITRFLHAWGVSACPSWVFATCDSKKEGCARTKNRGIADAIEHGYEAIVVLDDDCFPSKDATSLDELIERHTQALEPQRMTRFVAVTGPPSRGTPYLTRERMMPVAASMGFWDNVGDYDACAQLVHGATHPMQFRHEPIYGQYFALSGMNIAFRAEWWPICQFIDVPRFDDIWQGLIWQKIAYSQGYCFNLNGPIVTHSRQSNVFANLRDEARNMEANETLWQRIDAHRTCDYDQLRALVSECTAPIPKPVSACQCNQMAK